MRDIFERSADAYESRLGPDHVDPLRAALIGIPTPRRAIDIGTGTGAGAEVLADAFPSAWVCGIDLSLGMIRVGAADPRLRRVELLVADAAVLPFPSSSFELVVSIAVPLFAAELSRVLAEGGIAIVSFPRGDETPIFLPSEVLEDQLQRAGFDRIEHGRAGRGTFTRARKR